MQAEKHAHTRGKSFVLKDLTSCQGGGQNPVQTHNIHKESENNWIFALGIPNYQMTTASRLKFQSVNELKQ